jgi:hypothetical protein
MAGGASNQPGMGEREKAKEREEVSKIQRVRVRGKRKINGDWRAWGPIYHPDHRYYVPSSAWAAVSLFVLLMFVLSILGGEK